MAERKNIPQILALCKRVEELFGQSLRTHKDFENLSIDIEQKIHTPLSESTLERVWGYSTRTSDAISNKTLDCLSRFVGMKNWTEFKTNAKDLYDIESNVISGNIIDSDSLRIGTLVRLTWLPDRECVCKYLGGHRFIVQSVKNAHLNIGDTFSCIQFQPGHELFLDKFVSVDNVEGRYIIGQKNGLVSADILT